MPETSTAPETAAETAPALPAAAVTRNLVRELDKVADYDGWRALVAFGLDQLLRDNQQALVLEVVVNRAMRHGPADPGYQNMALGERVEKLLRAFDLKLTLARKRGDKAGP